MKKVLKRPGPHARENVQIRNQGRFFEDYCNWERIDEFKEFIFNSPASEIVAQATGSNTVQIFHEHIFKRSRYIPKKLLGIKIFLTIV